MLGIDDFSRIIIDRVDTLVDSERLHISMCLGRASAESILAPYDMPETPRSAMDGYAMRAADWEKGVACPVSQKIFAGALPQAHSQHTVARIFTGSTVPEGADCVIIQENTQVQDGKVLVLTKPQVGDNIRQIGSNFRQGQILLTSGTLVNQPRLSLAAMAGMAEMLVRRPVQVTLCTLGDELQPLGSELQPGKIYDSNSHMIQSLLVSLGCQVEHRHLPDDPQVISQALVEAASNSDLVISSGGASVGERDYVFPILTELGDVQAWKVAIKPGKPTLFGTIDKAYFFGLPGNPSSSLVTLCLFVRLAICRLLGLPPCINAYRMTLMEHARNTYVNTSERDHFVYCRQRGEYLFIDDQHNSASLQSASQATGICRVVSGAQVQGGDLIAYYPFAELFALPSQ